MTQPGIVHLVWNAGKDAHAGNRLVKELGPMKAVQELTKTLIKATPGLSEFDAINMSSNVLQYQTMLAQGFMPCHATRQRVNNAAKRSSREQRPQQDLEGEPA